MRQNRFQFIGSAEGCIGLGVFGSNDGVLGSVLDMTRSLSTSSYDDDPENNLEDQKPTRDLKEEGKVLDACSVLDEAAVHMERELAVELVDRHWFFSSKIGLDDVPRIGGELPWVGPKDCE